jgi:predicted histidine transporter YuiF (NhaC family)
MLNAVLIAVTVMLILSLLRINVVFALIVGALVGGLTGGLGIAATIEAFTNGLGGSATIALSYALLGAFAVALSKTGLPDAMVATAIKVVGKEGEEKRKTLSKVLILLIILIISIFSQNVVPVHIAFIPVLIPPLLKVLNELQVDRRLIATIIAFGLITPYMYLPVGFGAIFQGIMQTNMEKSGLEVSLSDIPTAMAIPALGMVVGLLIAIFFTYRKKRHYETREVTGQDLENPYTKKSIMIGIIAIFASLSVQLYLSQKLEVEGMIFGALAGLIVLFIGGVLKRNEADIVITNGMKIMAFIGFVMITASGFASVIQETGHVEQLVEKSANLIGGNQAIGALLMLLVGLLVTMGIGSSFSTVPIITAIFVPLCIQLGFSPMATIAIIGTAGALGDAGSPASDSTLGPTSGLSVDGNHNHIWDTCVPTFIHYNIPLIIFGWIAAIIL